MQAVAQHSNRLANSHTDRSTVRAHRKDAKAAEALVQAAEKVLADAADDANPNSTTVVQVRGGNMDGVFAHVSGGLTTYTNDGSIIT